MITEMTKFETARTMTSRRGRRAAFKRLVSSLTPASCVTEVLTHAGTLRPIPSDSIDCIDEKRRFLKKTRLQNLEESEGKVADERCVCENACGGSSCTKSGNCQVTHVEVPVWERGSLPVDRLNILQWEDSPRNTVQPDTLQNLPVT